MSLHSLDMNDQETEDALTLTAVGGLSLQQYPYESPDLDFEFATVNDVLKPVVVKPYKPRSKVPRKDTRQPNQLTRLIPVPNLDDVQPFMSLPDYVEKSGSDLEALLVSQHMQNPFPFPGDIDVLPSYSDEHRESDHSTHLRKHLEHALAHAWKFDLSRCSAKATIKLSRIPAGGHRHGLAHKDYAWIRGGKSTTARKAQRPARVDFKQARRSHLWMKDSAKDDEILNIDGNSIQQELDEFYGPDGTDLRPLNNDSDEGFSEPNPITTTILSLPNKSLSEEGVTPRGIFQDSGISMDESYAEYSLAHSVPNSAKESTGKVTGDWSTFNANVAPLRTPKQRGPWLGLIGDQKQCGWPGRRQGLYDVHDLRSRETNHLLDRSSKDMHNKNLLPADAASLTEPLQRAPGISEPVQENVDSVPSEATPKVLGHEQLSILHNRNESLTSSKQTGVNEASVCSSHSASEERPQRSPSSIECDSNSRLSVPAPHEIREVLHVEHDISAHTRRSIPNTAFTTPINQRVRQSQHVQVDTPATPSTVNIHLTPEPNSEMGAGDASDASDASLEVRMPSSPIMDTQQGQSALDRYIQETESHLDLAHHNNSMTSLDDNESDELSLIPRLEPPDQPKGLTLFSKAVGLHQKQSDALFTLSPPKASQDTSSARKMPPIPVTPANGNDSPLLRPMTPFQLGTPSHLDLNSPGTPTPAPKVGKAKGKSVMNVFNSPKLGSRSPERAQPSSDIIVAPTTPAAGAIDPHGGGLVGSQGLLFQQAKLNERSTQNVLNSMKLSPKRRSGPSEGTGPDDYEDELAGGGGTEVFKKGKGAQGTPSSVRSGSKRGPNGGRKMARAVVVPRARASDQNEGMQAEGTQKQEPQKKKVRRSTRTSGGDATDM